MGGRDHVYGVHGRCIASSAGAQRSASPVSEWVEGVRKPTGVGALRRTRTGMIDGIKW